MKRALLIVSMVIAMITACAQSPKKTDTVSPKNSFIDYDFSPKFPGGESALNKFINNNLRWPADQTDAQVHVIVIFQVEKNGALSSFKISKPVFPLFDAEALRVMKLSPRWIPASRKGKPVTAIYRVPINFQLQ